MTAGDIEAAMKRKPCKVLILVGCLSLAIAIISQSGAAAGKEDENKLLADFKAGNQIALLRHALAPGTGDPENFMLGDCTTQRNLSQAGRDQAIRIGDRFKQAGITVADVYTSEWCRCRETAELLGLGIPVPLPSLNSFFRNYEREDPQTEALYTWLGSQQLSRPLILVTHQVNITAFSSIYPASGEVVLMRRNPDGLFEVTGSIRTE